MIGTALSACTSLRVLRVNLDFEEHDPDVPYQYKDSPFDESAIMLASKIATLEEVALFYVEAIQGRRFFKWSRYFIDRTDTEKIKLSELPHT